MLRAVRMEGALAILFSQLKHLSGNIEFQEAFVLFELWGNVWGFSLCMQSVGLYYSWKKAGAPGQITRLLSCSQQDLHGMSESARYDFFRIQDFAARYGYRRSVAHNSHNDLPRLVSAHVQASAFRD